MKKRFIIAIIIASTSIIGLFTGGFLLYSCRYCSLCKTEFSSPAYELPMGSHHNPTLDNVSIVNQTILNGLETALWAFTRLRRADGFPLGSLADGSKMWSDRGPRCPLLPREFSIQEGTPLVGGIYLEMYQIEPNPIYLSVAKDVGDALLAVQDKEGGFYYDGRRRGDGTGYDPHPHNIRKSTILDDNVMQSCMSYLLDLYNITGDLKYLIGFEKAVMCLNSIELQHGAWKQRSNFPIDAYQSQATLNDNALHDVVMVLLKAHNMFPANPTYLQAAIRAGEFLFSTQGNGGSAFQKGWAQQYDVNLQPCWARDFEPPAICSMQTASSIRILMELYLTTNDTKWLTPIPDAITWLNSSETKLGENTWARLYELETNIPIYGIEKGKQKNPQYVYDPTEARSGYSWQGSFLIPSTMNNYQKLVDLSFSASSYKEWRSEIPDLESQENLAYSYIKVLSSEGFWITEGVWTDELEIISRIFAQNCQEILLYLNLTLNS
ncbi:MAG: hypothetical protein JW776_11720 [Candidatus Lokiarchaeota archaeon]|nr:hypothetical protein [Candidatus Lokiarchaeota archaeon]